MKFGVGQAVTRKEDTRLLTGVGTYVDDITLPGQAHAYFLRSPVAHAKVTAISTKAAQGANGVLGVYTDADPAFGSLTPLETAMKIKNADGSNGNYPGQQNLARGVVHYVGQPIALIVAESPTQARDAAELIEVDYEELPFVIDAEVALGAGAPLLHKDAPENMAYAWEAGDEAATDLAFENAVHVSKLRIVNPRIIVNTVEPRAINAEYNSSDERWTIWCATQGPHSMQGQLAPRLGVKPSRIRVRTPDVGGGFGMKLMIHPEYASVCKAAEVLGRPVKWTADRSESFLGDLQGRDLVTDAEAACDANGKIIGMRLRSVSNLGAYPSLAGPACHSEFCGDLAPTVYTIPAVHNRVLAAYTNTTPTDAYRGAGRPEQNYIMERVMDRVGADLGIAQDEIRRRNLAQPEQMPWTTAMGVTFDSGNFPAVLEKALAVSDFAGFETRRTEAAARGKHAGIGLISYMERTGGGPVEHARIQVIPASGDEPQKVRIWAGTQSTGQGHETAFAQIVHERLAVPYECIEWVAGDSDGLPGGGGTGGSRSLIMAGRSFLNASDDIIEKARPGAAEALEADPADIEFHPDENGQFRVAGTDRSVSLFEAVEKLPEQEEEGLGLTGEGDVNEPKNSFPNGCHICEVEVDPATGHVDLKRYTVVDDFGVLLNPLLVKGQVMGGVVQGIGEALCEEAIYDPETGQPLTGSLMDYRMPRSDDMPNIDIEFEPTRCTTNELGVKGCGEAGTVGACPVVVVAALDALRPLGVKEIDMPLTPIRVWNAIETAKGKLAAE